MPSTRVKGCLARLDITVKQRHHISDDQANSLQACFGVCTTTSWRGMKYKGSWTVALNWNQLNNKIQTTFSKNVTLCEEEEKKPSDKCVFSYIWQVFFNFSYNILYSKWWGVFLKVGGGSFLAKSRHTTPILFSVKTTLYFKKKKISAWTLCAVCRRFWIWCSNIFQIKITISFISQKTEQTNNTFYINN